MERRETYATTGTRMAVRFFGGYGFEAKDATTRNPAMISYSKGVPMGGDLDCDQTAGRPGPCRGAARPDRGKPDRYRTGQRAGWMPRARPMSRSTTLASWSDGRGGRGRRQAAHRGYPVDVANAT